jgi:EpsI family protein
VFAIVAMAIALGSVWRHSRPEAKGFEQRLTMVPLTLGNDWAAEVDELPERQLEKLRASEVLLRHYHPLTAPSSASGEAEPGPLRQLPATLFVAYYSSQRTGATYHSPKHCLPGAGWQITSTDQLTVAGPYGGDVRINEAVIQDGLAKQVILYWYQDRGRIVASEYAAKVYLVWDALTKNRSDGALVRVSVVVDGDLDVARRQALRFVQDMWTPLSDALTS